MKRGNLLERRIVNSFKYSLSGLKIAWKSEESIRVEIFACAILAPLGFYLGKSRLEQALMIGSLALVLITELLNTAVEKTVDRISLERNSLSAAAKDIGSAAVLIAIINMILIWALLLI